MRFLHRVLTASIALALCGAAPGALPQVAPNGHVPYVAVLVWHDVEPSKQVWFDVDLATFRSQLDAIARGGFHVVTLDALRAHLERGAPLPSKPLVLTFDDNGYGIYAYAFPELRKRHFPATLFVHTNYVGKTTSKRHSGWNELREMERSGLVRVQSLTANHPEDLRALSDAAVMHEFTLARFSIAHRLGHEAYAVAYPYDNYDARVTRLADRAGYALGFSEDWGNAGDSDTLLTVHRYSVLTRFDQALHDVAAGGH